MEGHQTRKVGSDQIMNDPVGLHLVIGYEPGFHRPWI